VILGTIDVLFQSHLDANVMLLFLFGWNRSNQQRTGILSSVFGKQCSAFLQTFLKLWGGSVGGRHGNLGCAGCF